MDRVVAGTSLRLLRPAGPDSRRGGSVRKSLGDAFLAGITQVGSRKSFSDEFLDGGAQVQARARSANGRAMRPIE